MGDMDDFYVICKNRNQISKFIQNMSNYLINNLMVKLHPDKIYIQHYRKGLKFTCSVVKGKRLYTSNTTVSNTYMSIHKFNGEISAENV